MQSWNWNAVDIDRTETWRGFNQCSEESRIKGRFYTPYLNGINPLYKEDVNKYVEQHMLPQMKDLLSVINPIFLA
jgi:alpha-L-fucosidase